jgi:hypothetical protein
MGKVGNAHMLSESASPPSEVESHGHLQQGPGAVDTMPASPPHSIQPASNSQAAAHLTPSNRRGRDKKDEKKASKVQEGVDGKEEEKRSKAKRRTSTTRKPGIEAASRIGLSKRGRRSNKDIKASGAPRHAGTRTERRTKQAAKPSRTRKTKKTNWTRRRRRRTKPAERRMIAAARQSRRINRWSRKFPPLEQVAESLAA